MINLTYKQAQQIVDAFGGDEETVVVLKTGGGHSGNGIYLGYKDSENEGSQYLGAEEA